MIRRPPRSTRTDTLFPYTTLFRSKYVTRAPDLLDSEFRIGAGLSSVLEGDQGWNVRFGASLPLQEDRLGLRVSYARNELPGYTDNAVDGREDINGGSQTGARAALVWDGDAFDLTLAARSEEHTS